MGKRKPVRMLDTAAAARGAAGPLVGGKGRLDKAFIKSRNLLASIV